MLCRYYSNAKVQKMFYKYVKISFLMTVSIVQTDNLNMLSG